MEARLVEAKLNREADLRVCLMNDNFYRSSGVAIAIRRIAESFTRVEYCVAGCNKEDHLEDLTWIPAGKYAHFDLKSNNPLIVIRELIRFKRWFRAQRCDLVNSHHRRLAALMRLANIPVVYTGQLVFDEALWFRLLHPRYMTAITPSVGTNLFETTGQAVVRIIGNIAPFPEKPPSICVDRVRSRAVCIARLEPVKGHSTLLDAWKILADRGHRHELHLVGEGSLRPALEKQIQRDGLQDLVFFRGYSSDVSAIVDECLFAILPSRIEGQGIVTIEAAARGRASLLTAVPGSVDVTPPSGKLTNGIAYGNARELADALEQWFANPQEVVAEGIRFFDFLKPMADASIIARQYEDVYQSICGPQPAKTNLAPAN